MAEFTLSLSRFLVLPSFKGSANEIYAKALGTFHSAEKHTEADWFQVLEALKNRPSSDHVMRAVAPNPARPARRR